MRHKWDQPAGTHERHCQRCPAVIRKYAGGPHGPRRILTRYPNAHVQWIPRQHLEAAA